MEYRTPRLCNLILPTVSLSLVASVALASRDRWITSNIQWMQIVHLAEKCVSITYQASCILFYVGCDDVEAVPPVVVMF